ncbi:MAG TPA: redoxin domain-containing protein [Bacteroidota bacterium]|nr:redoxin domain-containing protein [Bacteroidota bacterium]
MALQVGQKAHDFTLVDTEKKPHSLKEFLGKKSVIVFYPGAFTGVCTKEVCAFRDAMANFNSMNAQVVGISVDSPFANKVFADQNKVAFPLLSDFTHSVSRQYAGTYPSFAGIDGYEAAKRAVFVLDPQGVVKYAWISENPGVEPPYEEVKAAVAKA